MIKVGDTLLNGAIVVAEVNADGLITKITIPLLGAPGVPFTVTFDPAQTAQAIEELFSGTLL